MEEQSTHRLIMVRPSSFGFNAQTAQSNRFQKEFLSNDPLLLDQIQRQALNEFDQMVEQLRSHRIHVDVFDDSSPPIRPDAIFPNNWFSTHADGTIILYPMLAENRRLERRLDLIKRLTETSYVTAMIDLTINEQRNCFLEGTGSLIFDRVYRRIYATRSARTDPILVERLIQLMNYQKPSIIFDSVDSENHPIYHTNVMMALGTKLAIICLQSIRNVDVQQQVIQSLEQNGQRRIIEITMEQMKNFAGNMLEIRNEDGEYFLVMSKAAYQSLTDQQRQSIEETNIRILFFDISTIEQYGGGSVRCMIAENFLPSLTSNARNS